MKNSFVPPKRLTPEECLERYPFLVSVFNWNKRTVTAIYNAGFLNGIYSSSHKGILVNEDSLVSCIHVLLERNSRSREEIEAFLRMM